VTLLPLTIMVMFETFEHTADLGIRVRAADRASLFVEAGRALFSVIVDDPSTIRPIQMTGVEISGTQADYLLFDWLNEWLFRFETERRLFCRFEVNLTPEGLSGGAWGERFDEARHRLAHEVKAITYHQLVVQETTNGWLAEFIVDI
jgi:SHS2 domain-containing protein